jgi:hypothetical protein
MARKKKEPEEALKAGVVEHDKEDVKEFEFATIVLTCKCGHTQEMIRHVQHGIQFIIATNDQAALVLHCEKCGSELKLHCVEGTPPPEEKTIELLTDEDTAKKIVENPNVEVESIEIDEDIPEESTEGEPL